MKSGLSMGSISCNMKIQVLGVDKNKLGRLLATFSFKKVYLGTLQGRCLKPKLSSFKFLSAFGIFETQQGLPEAVKLSNVNLYASKLDTSLMKGSSISSITKKNKTAFRFSTEPLHLVQI